MFGGPPLGEKHVTIESGDSNEMLKPSIIVREEMLLQNTHYEHPFVIILMVTRIYIRKTL